MAGLIAIGCCVLIMLVGLSFVLGAAAGAGLTYDQFKEIALPLLDAAGGWVSGLGALAAVAASLWLADRQRREDVEHLNVRPRLSFVPGVGWMLSINAVSDGRRPATVTSVIIRSAYCKKKQLQLLGFYHKSHELPATLHYGEVLSLLCNASLRQQLDGFIQEHCGGRHNGLKVFIDTTTSSFNGAIDGNLLPFLRGEYDSASERLCS